MSKIKMPSILGISLLAAKKGFEPKNMLEKAVIADISKIFL